MADLQIDAAVDQVLETLDSSDGGDSAPQSDEAKVMEILEAGDGSQGQDPGETVSDTDAGEVEAGEAEETARPIEPPVSWKAEWKEDFKNLPRDWQDKLVTREREREVGLSKSQQESAESRKAADADREAVQAERKAYSDRLTQIIDVVNTTDPIIAEGRKMDWATEHEKNPLEAPAKFLRYQQAEHRLRMLAGERDQAVQKLKADKFAKSEAKLKESLDFWSDNDKRSAFQSELSKYLGESGYSNEEINSADDYRDILMGRKAMLYDKLMAEQSRIEATKKVIPQGKVLRTQSTQTSPGNARAEALKRTAIRSGRVDDAAAAILASL